MRGFIFFSMACLGVRIFAQVSTPQPIIGAMGYSYPIPLSVAPGQMITVFVDGANTQLTAPVRAVGTSLPTMLAGVSVTYRQGMDQPVPILEVRPISTCLGIPLPPGGGCTMILAVTAQMPFNMLTVCPVCGRLDIPATVGVTVNGVTGPLISVQPLADQVHFLTTCDVMTPGSQPRIYPTKLPCTPTVTHADGKPVSATNPAKGGEELVAYAVGLGQTNPPLTAGESASTAAPTVTLFAIDFNYRRNALPTQPAGPSFFFTPDMYPTPVFTGATAGFVGLYQINFIVPPVPNGLPTCVDTTGIVPFTNVVQSNLTVSVGSAFSFDGAGICVQPIDR